ncbi:sugar kinase [Streptomyces sp. N35]|uniref:sugar kinase n=1 Tax=Streptomyces sp. N35 TaxID=2795730 RepID=UPI0027DD3C3B|nr:sugar kinase [Streptomyces sp. N35]
MPHQNVPGPGAAAEAPRFDVACLGESMVTFRPTRPGRLADVPGFDRGIGGAESNVACTLARAGHSARWIGRVGDDGFGEYLTREIAHCGVDTSAVRRDGERPTGIYFRTAGDRATDAHEVAYYRAGSAASAMSVANVDLDGLRSARIVHLSGITAALSDDCLALMRELAAPRAGRPLVSFDVNHRPGLWRTPEDARVLLELARGADLVFVGDDEAAAAWGVTDDPDAIRAALPEPRTLVVKQGATGATVFHEDVRVCVPALSVDVVAAVGAGGAFAPRFLSPALPGLPAAPRLEHRHPWAAAALTVPGDMAEPPGRAHADHLAALPDEEWGTLRLGPGWTRTGAKGEVTTS